jgi:hypothetical protein
VAAERWAVVVDAPLYEVSTEGRVRRGAFDVATWENARGYLHVNLEGPRAWPIVRAVHRLVLEAFNPTTADDVEAHHRDGDKRNNQLVNLRWVTHAENVQHAWDSGLQPRARAKRDGCLYGHVRSQVYVDKAGQRRVRCARCRRAHYHRAQAVRRRRAWLFAELSPPPARSLLLDERPAVEVEFTSHTPRT